MKLSRKEFAKKGDFNPTSMGNYISRGKVVEEDGKINTANPVNKAFLESRKLIAPRKGKKSNVRQPAMADPQVKKNRNALLELEQERKRAEIDLKRQQTRAAELKGDRMLGQYLPLHLVKHLFTTHFKSISMAFKDGIDKFITDVAAKAKLNQNDIAHLRRQMTDMINKSIIRAEAITESEINAADDSNKQVA